MARYRLTKLSFHGGALCPAGSVVEYSGVPGSNMEPLDDEGRAVVAAAQAGRLKPKAGSLNTGGRTLVEIPKGWEELDGREIVMLARKLGAPIAGTNKVTATTFINDELARRATV